MKKEEINRIDRICNIVTGLIVVTMVLAVASFALIFIGIMPEGLILLYVAILTITATVVINILAGQKLKRLRNE